MLLLFPQELLLSLPPHELLLFAFLLSLLFVFPQELLLLSLLLLFPQELLLSLLLFDCPQELLLLSLLLGFPQEFLLLSLLLESPKLLLFPLNPEWLLFLFKPPEPFFFPLNSPSLSFENLTIRFLPWQTKLSASFKAITAYFLSLNLTNPHPLLF